MDKSSKNARSLLGIVAILEIGLAALFLTGPHEAASTWAYCISPVVLVALLALDFRVSEAKRTWVRAASLGWVLLLCGLTALWIYEALWGAFVVFVALAPLRAVQLLACWVALMAATKQTAPTPVVAKQATT